jgi:tetratricopeptide (TPR) repeat protein
MRALHRRPWTSIAAISTLVVIAGRAHAQSAEAAALFDDGDKLFKQGKIAEACEAFEASNRIEARAGTLIRLGDCRERLGQLASAWSAFKDALIRVKDPRKQKLAKDHVAALEPRLSYLTIAVARPTDGLAILRDGKPVDPVEWNRAIPIDGGTYEIVASAPHHVTWKDKATVPAERGQITVELPALADDPVPYVRNIPTNAAWAHAERQALYREPSAFTTKRIVAVGVLGAGVAAGVVGIVLGESAKSKQDSAYALCPDPAQPCTNADAANALIATGHSRAYEADAAFGVAGVAAIVASVLWFTGGPEVAIDPASRSVVVSGRF